MLTLKSVCKSGMAGKSADVLILTTAKYHLSYQPGQHIDQSLCKRWHHFHFWEDYPLLLLFLIQTHTLFALLTAQSFPQPSSVRCLPASRSNMYLNTYLLHPACRCDWWIRRRSPPRRCSFLYQRERRSPWSESSAGVGAERDKYKTNLVQKNTFRIG